MMVASHYDTGDQTGTWTTGRDYAAEVAELDWQILHHAGLRAAQVEGSARWQTIQDQINALTDQRIALDSGRPDLERADAEYRITRAAWNQVIRVRGDIKRRRIAQVAGLAGGGTALILAAVNWSVAVEIPILGALFLLAAFGVGAYAWRTDQDLIDRADALNDLHTAAKAERDVLKTRFGRGEYVR
jgi:hypothetical protein